MSDQQQPGTQKALGRVALVGSALQAAGRGLRALIGIVTVAVLARLLSPSDFGAFALIYALVMLAQVFADLGLRVALVQKADITDLECQSVFWVSTVSGALLTLSLLVLAQPIADLFDSPEIVDAIRAISPIFIIVGMRGVPLALLERRFAFKQIAASDLVAAVAGSVVAIGFAYAGYTVGALVAQQVAMVVALAVSLFRSARWLPRLLFSWAALKPLAGYGSYVTLSGILYAAGPMIQRPLISTRLTTADLGYLTMSDQLIFTPVRIIGNSVNRVTFPLLSSIQADTGRIVAAHRNTTHALALAIAPIVAGIAALAEPTTILLLGAGWAPMMLILAIYAPRALALTIAEMNHAVFAAKGQARFQFRWGVFSLLASTGVLLLSLPYGAEAVALGQLLTSILIMLIQTWFLARLLGTPAFGLLGPMMRPLLAAIVMGALVHALDRALGAQGLTMFLRAACGAAAGALCYIGILLLIDREALLGLWNKVRAARQARTR